MSPMAKRIPAERPMAWGWRRNWRLSSLPMLNSEAARLTMMPAAVEMMRAGIWETRASPMVRIV